MEISKPKSLLVDLVILLIINTILVFIVFPKLNTVTNYGGPSATVALLQHFMNLNYHMLFYIIIIQYILLFIAYLSYICDNKVAVCILIIEGIFLLFIIYGFFMIEHAIDYNNYLKKLNIIKNVRQKSNIFLYFSSFLSTFIRIFWINFIWK